MKQELETLALEKGKSPMSSSRLSVPIALAVGSLFIAGCATKNYVKESITPVEQKIEEVDRNSQKRDSQQVADLNKTNQQVEENEKTLSATTEMARTADAESKSATAKANQNAKDINDLRNLVANIDDYKPASESTVVYFKVNQDTLSEAEKAKLDQLAMQVGSMQRYLLTVEGFTDQTGTRTYNDELSQKRANQVISYLVGSHDIPIYRIHTVGLGEQQLIDEGKGKKARKQSRRVEITVYTAKPLSTPGTGGN